VQELAPQVLRHRIGLTYEAEAEEVTARQDHRARSSSARPSREVIFSVILSNAKNRCFSFH